MGTHRKIFLSVLLAGALAAGCNRPAGYVAINGYAQGGTYTVKISMEGVEQKPAAIKEAIDGILTDIDTVLSGYNSKSQLSRFNRGEVFTPSPLFEKMYLTASQYFKETGGALDAGSAPLFDIWGFGFTEDSLPPREKIDSALSRCGILHSGKSLRESMGQGYKLNFNAIAQGFSCDTVASYLRKIGVKDMLVDIGEIYCQGRNPDGKGWGIGVDKPILGNQEKGAELSGVWRSSGDSCGVVTSGNYRKFYVKDGQMYSHTIDPRTGYPAGNNLLSATIVARNATDADAYATYCMVIGLEKSREFISSRDDLEGYLIWAEGDSLSTWASPGFREGMQE